MPDGVLASIVIPVFNGAPWLAAAVASVQASIAHCAAHLPAAPEPAFEIIVCDDASTDDSRACAEALARQDPRVRVVAHATNQGAGPARNTGAAAARGDLLFFLDVDDFFLPPHILACLQELVRVEEAGLVKTNIDFEAPVTPDWEAAIVRSVVFNTAVWRRCHEAVGGFPTDPGLRTLRCEDVFYCDLLIGLFPARWIAARTVHHRIRPGGAFESQRQRFAGVGGLAPGAGVEAPLTPEQRAVLPDLLASHRARRAALGLA